MKQLLKSVLITILFVASGRVSAQVFLNGDFENNTAGTDQINLSNATFNSMMSDVTGFGSYGDIDIITSATWCGLAQSGNWYIAFTGTGTDAAAIKLSQPLVAGNTYTLSFYDRGATGYIPYPFDIGLSTTNNSFGDTVLIGTQTPVVCSWTQRIISFVAPNNGQYLTVWMDGGGLGDWAHVDNFQFLTAANYNNTCFGDSTQFSISNTGTLAGALWNFDDINSGSNNTSSTFNPTHYFTAPGNYNVQLIMYLLNGNTDTAYLNVTIGALPTINLGNDTTLCNGNVLVLNAGSGYSCMWQDGSTDSTYTVSSAGTYSVTAGDNGCTTTDSIIVSFIPCNAPNVNLASSDTLFCEKQCLDFFDLSTNNPVSWQWYFQGATPDTSTLQNPTGICYNNYGSFDVKLIACNNNGCDSIILTSFIKEFQNPTDSIWQSNDTLFSLPAATYQWYETSSGIIAGAINSFYVTQQTGSYYCLITDSAGCVATSNIIVISGLNQLMWPTADLVIFPNPGDGHLQLFYDNQLMQGPLHISITDALGAVVYQSEAEPNSRAFSISLANGIYLLQLKAGDKVATQKLLIKN